MDDANATAVRATWSASLRWTTGVGLVCAITLWGWLPPAAVAFTIAGIASLLTWSFLADGEREAIRRSIDVGVSAGLTVTAAVGLVTALGLSGLVLVLVGTAPTLRTWVRARSRRRRSPGAADVGPRPADTPPVIEELRLTDVPGSLPEDCRDLDDAALVLAWRRSFLHLQQAACRADKLAAVEMRQRYLDELCRRCPEGMASWLAAGARASGNPMPYLEKHPRGPR